MPSPRLHRVLSVAVRLVAAWFLLHSTAIIYDGFHDEGLAADVAVVLASKVKPDGTPSLSLQRRIERAVRLFSERRVKAVIVSGGQGREGFQEADIMRDYSIRGGVPAGNIVTDPKGDNTRLTALHTREIMRERGWRSAIVVTQYWHISRAKLALREAGVPLVTGAHAEYRAEIKDPLYLVREWVGYYAYVLRR